MSNSAGKSLAKTSEKPTAIQSIDGWNQEQITLIKNTVAKGVTDAELNLFLYVCKRTGLDPLVKQIHAVKRYDNMLEKEVMSIQTGIDGYRLTAHRTNEMDGEEGPFWCGDDGEWKEVWLSKTPHAAAKVIVFRKGHAHSYVGVARYDAYVQTKKGGLVNHMWSKMPDNQLAKCAEALALRKAFPNELSGTHTEDEIPDTDDVPPNSTAPKAIDAEVVDAGSAPSSAAPANASAPAQAAASQDTPASTSTHANTPQASQDLMVVSFVPKIVTVSKTIGHYNVTDINGAVRFTSSRDIASKCKESVGKEITVTISCKSTPSEIIKIGR